MDARVTEFAAADAAARFPELLARAEAGEEIVIRRGGRAVATLSAVASLEPAMPTVEQRLAAWEEWFRYRDANGISLPAGMTASDLLDDVRRG